jgi:hypothetical protein
MVDSSKRQTFHGDADRGLGNIDAPLAVLPVPQERSPICWNVSRPGAEAMIRMRLPGCLE